MFDAVVKVADGKGENVCSAFQAGFGVCRFGDEFDADQVDVWDFWVNDDVKELCDASVDINRIFQI